MFGEVPELPQFLQLLARVAVDVISNASILVVPVVQAVFQVIFHVIGVESLVGLTRIISFTSFSVGEERDRPLFLAEKRLNMTTTLTISTLISRTFLNPKQCKQEEAWGRSLTSNFRNYGDSLC